MRSSPFERGLALGLLALCLTAAGAQEMPYGNIGSMPDEQLLTSWDIAISPDGDELPPGQGTAREGEPLYFAKCASCHGPNMQGRPDIHVAGFVGGEGTLNTLKPKKTVGSYWAFATMLWDYINRAMPRFEEGTLTPDEVYAVSAYILYKNGIIGQDKVMNAETLPNVKMPNRDGFIPAKLEDIADPEARGCRMGHCP